MKGKKNILLVLTLFILLFSPFIYSVKSDNLNNSHQIDKLCFRQEIKIPIDTSLPRSKYYPIDIKIIFDNPCWAKDNKNHSIRIGYYIKNSITEIESQIYNLEFIDKNHIKSCKIVFLIPEKADGSERYYVFYDKIETTSVKYIDHLNLIETSYYYEPIQGQKLDFNCFQIEQEKEIIYMIVKQGKILGYPFSNVIIRLKPDSFEPRIEYLEEICDLTMDYGIPNFPDYIGSAYAKNPKTKIISDGNLMVRFEIEGISPREDLKTSNIYTYYYCPDTIRRIYTDVNHEVLKDIQIDDPSLYDGSYAGLVSLKARSKSIAALNIGEFYPMLALVNENDITVTFKNPLNPRTNIKDFVLTRNDDVDLGKSAWICFYDPIKAKTHGLILNSNKDIVKNSTDGVQVKAWVEENVKLPGLEGGSSNLYIMKNSYEKGSNHEITLSKGHMVNFQSLFVSIEQQEYTVMSYESTIFQEWIKKTSFKDKYIEIDNFDEGKKYNITTYINFAPSFPFGVLLSATTGKNISFISAELYKEEDFRSAGTVKRIPLHNLDIILQETDLKTIIGLFDIKNASFSKKIIFPNLEPGKYIIKIYKENSFFSKNKKFIGFKIVDIVDTDLKTRIICSTPTNINCLIVDSSGQPIKDVEFLLKYQNSPIQKTVSNNDGLTVISIPFILKNSYTLEAYYKGFLIVDEEINLRLKNIIVDLNKKYELTLNSLLLDLKDKWILPIDVDIKPFLISEKMIKPVLISGEKLEKSIYLFENLPSAEYIVKLSYKSLDFQKEIKIYKNEKLDLIFPGEFRFDINVFNNIGEIFNSGIIKIERGGLIQTFSVENAKKGLFIPPGTYTVSVLADDNVISKQIVIIQGERELDIYTSKSSVLYLFLIIVSVFLILISLFFIFFKKKKSLGLKLLILSLLISSIILPWWSLNGVESTNSTNTHIFLAPNKMINYYEYNDYKFSDINQIPNEFYTILSIIYLLILISIALVFLSIFFKKKSEKINIIIMTIVTILVISSVSIFFYTVSLITEYGLGSVIGKDLISTQIPWNSVSYSVNASWGLDFGFYFIILVIIINLFYLIFRKRFIF
jgi:hypothetical protein